jgi:hypothetical protein
VNECQRDTAAQLTAQRAAEMDRLLEVRKIVDRSFPTPPRPGKGPRTEPSANLDSGNELLTRFQLRLQPRRPSGEREHRLR